MRQNLVLIADESPKDASELTKLIEGIGNRVIVCRDGVEAVKIFNEKKPDIVILNSAIQKLGGLVAARFIKEKAGDRYVPIMFITEVGEKVKLSSCLQNGDDVLEKPFDREILQAKLSVFSRLIDLDQRLKEQRDKLSYFSELQSTEHAVAKKIFDSIAHTGVLGAHNIKYSLSPMATFNGDVLLAAYKPSGDLHVMLGDFTGHGLPASIGTIPTADAFYAMTDKGFSMPAILKEINQKLKSILPVGIFCAATFIDIDSYKGVARIWNGGLPPGVIYSHDGFIKATLPSKHPPLGVMNSNDFESDFQIEEIYSGDRIFLFSDGIVESMNSHKEMFGQKRLLKVFERNKDPDLLFNEINNAVQLFRGDEEQMDDATAIEVKNLGVPCYDCLSVHGKNKKSGGKLDCKFSLELRPDALKNFDPVPMILDLLMQYQNFSKHSAKIHNILSALYNNALEYGVLNLDPKLKRNPLNISKFYQVREKALEELKEGTVKVDVEYTPDEDGAKLFLAIEDSGHGFDYSSYLHQQTDSDSMPKRGIQLVKELSTSVNYVGNGNRVEIQYQWQ